MDSLMDLASSTQLDPSTHDGYSVLYEREVPVELRSADSLDEPSEVGALEALHVKLLVKGDGAAPDALRLELSSDSNLFFHYGHDMDAAAFARLQAGQHLMVDFPEYAAVLLRMLTACIKEPHAYLAIFVMKVNGTARLDFIQNMHYKFVELLACDFQALDEEAVRQHITYRHAVVRARLALMQAKLADVTALVKLKNPALLTQLLRSPPQPPHADAQAAPDR